MTYIPRRNLSLPDFITDIFVYVYCNRICELYKIFAWETEESLGPAGIQYLLESVQCSGE